MKNLLVGWGQYPVLVVKIKQIMITIRIIIEYIYNRYIKQPIRTITISIIIYVKMKIAQANLGT
jgi:hypothetical protein